MNKKPSEVAKSAGLDSLAELSRITGQSDKTLTNWFKNKKDLFRIVVQGAVIEKNKQ